MTIKLKPKHKYKDRKGREWTCLHKTSGRFPYLCRRKSDGKKCHFAADGSYWAAGDHTNDLIEEIA